MSMIVTSLAFAPGERIPVRFTGDGEDISPPLNWTGAPSGTREFALICDDPDAPKPHPWVHWIMYKIPSSVTSLAENVLKDEMPPIPEGARQGVNSWGKIGFNGPAPPKGHGVHRYHFGIYALCKSIELPPGMDKTSLLASIKGYIVMSGELIGTYDR